MEVKSSVVVPLGEENEVKCEFKTGVDSSSARQVPRVEFYDTTSKDRSEPSSVSGDKPSCEIHTVNFKISALYPIEKVIETSTAQSCPRITRPKRKPKLSSPGHMRVMSERFTITPSGTSISKTCCIQSTMNVPTSEISASRIQEDSITTGDIYSDCSVSSLLNSKNLEDNPRKRKRSPSEMNRKSDDSAKACERTRSVPSQTCLHVSQCHPHCEIDHSEMTSESSVLERVHNSIEVPSKADSTNTSRTKTSSKPVTSLKTSSPLFDSPVYKNSKLSNSCREDISRQPLGLISNSKRGRLPKRSSVRVVARKDLSTIAATNHPAARTRLYTTPSNKVVGGRKHREYLRLRAMLPAPRRRAAVSKVSVVCEAARHIEQLHGALIRRFRERLPPALAGCGLSSSDVGQRNIRQLVLRVLATCNPGSLPPAPLENTRNHQSAPHRPRGGDKRR